MPPAKSGAQAFCRAPVNVVARYTEPQMQKPAFDPGITQQYGDQLRRVVNKDGTFNVRRTGASWRAFHPWLHVVNMSWRGFAGLVLSLYLGINTLFALLYYSLDPS